MLSPTSESTTSFRQQQRSSVRSSSSSTSPRDRRNGDHRRQRQHHANGKGNSSRNWWRDRERELLQSNLSPKDLIRMVIEAEKETTKLHDTLSNTVTMLDEESRKCASLERDTVSTFTRLNSGRERAQAHAEAVAQDLRVAQFELEHTGREIERLKEELEVQKQMREEGEAQLTRVKNAAHKLRQERMVDLAREEGRRQGFEAGFLRAQAETTMKMRATTGGSALVPGRPRRDSEPIASTSQRPPHRETSRIAPPPPDQVPQVHRRPEVHRDQESIYEELSSIPIITPPQGLNPFPNTHKIPMRTGYSPTRRPARTRTKSPTPSAPSVDHYPVSIPPQEVIEQTQNINPQSTNPPREEWVTGEQHRDIHGHAPSPSPTTAIFNPNIAGHGPGTGLAGPTSIIQTSGTPTSAAKHRVKFRRPTLAKTKQTATSWYRSLSFRKKPKPKIVIDPTAEEEEEEEYTEVRDERATHPANEAGPSGTSAAERSQSLPTRTSDPAPSITAPPNSRHSKAASMSSTVRTRDYGFPFKAQGHRPRVGSVDSMSTHTSQFDMLTAPSVSMGGYSRSGPANTSVASLGSNAGAGKAPSVSGRSAKSAALSKKLSVIKENPSSREPTPGRPSHSQAPGQVPPASRFTENDIRSMRPVRSMRSMKSGKSTNSRMVVLNPDPESPDWARQASQPRTQIYAHPPSNSALMQSGMPNLSIYEGSGVIPPLRTKKSGQTITSLGGSQIGLNTPTPLPKSKDKGKGKEIVPPMIGHDRGASGSGHGTSPGIGINIQTPVSKSQTRLFFDTDVEHVYDSRTEHDKRRILIVKMEIS